MEDDKTVVLAEVVSALDKVPTDVNNIYKNVSELEKQGYVAQLATVINLIVDKLVFTEISYGKIQNELRLLRESIDDIRYVTVTRLAQKLQINPSLREGFTRVIEPNGEVYLYYEGSKLKADLYRGYDQLHKKLIKIYGYKEITYKVINNALLKSFNWTDIEISQNLEIDDSDLVMYILSKAELLASNTKLKKITIPQLKQHLNMKISSGKIKNILINADWKIVKHGTCKTLFFIKGED